MGAGGRSTWIGCYRYCSCRLKVKLSKYQLFCHCVPFLGHVVSAQVIEKDVAVAKWPAPHSVEDIHSFHRFCSFYRSFVEEFATISHPLTQLTAKGAW